MLTAEDEWAEMIASLIAYARNTRNLQFGLLSPMNEPDWDGIEGPQVDQWQYTHLMQNLSQRLDGLGLSAIRPVGPDTASVSTGVQTYFPEMMRNTMLMAKLAHFGLHNYAGSTAGAAQAIAASAYSNTNFWMTEVSNIWDAIPELTQGPLRCWSGMPMIVLTTMRSWPAGGPIRRTTPGMAQPTWPIIRRPARTRYVALFMNMPSSSNMSHLAHAGLPRRGRRRIS